jgi:hypothetical protein
MTVRRALLVMVLVFAAACTGGGDDTSGASGTTASTGTTAATGTTASSGASGSSGTGTGSPAVTGATANDCVPEAATSSGWQTHGALSGDFTMSFPAEWEDVSGDIGASAGELLSPETLAELGLSGSEPAPADVVRDPATGDNLGVFRFEGATSSTDDVYATHEDLYSTLSGIELTATGLTACVGGSPAVGMELSTEVAGEGVRYQQLWFLVRDGTLYHIYLDAADPATADVLAEVFRTWTWAT